MLHRDLDELLGDADVVKWKYDNTFIERHNDGAIAVRLYDTYILLYEDGGLLTINMGHYRTATTKKRINEIFDDEGWHVYSEKHKMYIWNWRTKKEYKFVNGMMLRPDDEGGYARATIMRPDGTTVQPQGAK